MRSEGLGREFIVIGENIHTSRVVMRAGKLVTVSPDGQESVIFKTVSGESRYLGIPDAVKGRQDYEEGRVKHVMIAVSAAMSGKEPDASIAMDYFATLVERQLRGKADFLDLNVDEVSIRLDDQIRAMRWLVQTIEEISPVPLSIDSSNVEIIRAGLDACKRRAGRPLLNSASLERIEALDLACQLGIPAIVTAAGESSMPQNTEERLANASRLVDLALSKGMPPGDIYIDPLVFPISVDGQFGGHFLETVRQLRARYGEDIHITGGLSNVSFGLPCRRLINEVFIDLSLQAGCDSGIVDPVGNDLHRVGSADRNSAPYLLAQDMLLGRDRNCKIFLRAYRKGELAATAG